MGAFWCSPCPKPQKIPGIPHSQGKQERRCEGPCQSQSALAGWTLGPGRSVVWEDSVGGVPQHHLWYPGKSTHRFASTHPHFPELNDIICIKGPIQIIRNYISWSRCSCRNRRVAERSREGKAQGAELQHSIRPNFWIWVQGSKGKSSMPFPHPHSLRAGVSYTSSLSLFWVLGSLRMLTYSFSMRSSKFLSPNLLSRKPSKATSTLQTANFHIFYKASFFSSLKFTA